LANEAKKIQAAQIRLQKSMKAFVTVMGVEAKKHFVSSFRNQGFTDESFKRWQSRKGEVSGFGVSKKSKGGRAILVKSGALRRSVKVLNKNYNSVTLGSSLPYAELHNDGGLIYRKAHKRTSSRTATVRGSAGFVNGVWKEGRGRKMKIMGERHNVSSSSFKMPKRQFIGESRKLTALLREKLNAKILQSFK